MSVRRPTSLRRCTGRYARWVCAACAALCLIGWALSLRRSLTMRLGIDDWGIKLQAGAFGAMNRTARPDQFARIGVAEVLPGVWHSPSTAPLLDVFWLPARYSMPYGTAGKTSLIVLIPLWIPFVFSSALGMLLWRRYARLRLLPPGCPTCGYSRAGLPTDASCPECGGAFA